MAVSQAEHPGVIHVRLLALDLHEPEVSSTVMSQAVGFTPDGELGGAQGPLNRLNELMMRDGLPRVGGPRGFDSRHLIQIHGSCAAVEDQVG